MNGAIAEPWVATGSAPNNAMVINIGARQNFLANAQERPKLAYEAAHLNFPQNCRLILDAPPADGSRSLQ